MHTSVSIRNNASFSSIVNPIVNAIYVLFTQRYISIECDRERDREPRLAGSSLCCYSSSVMCSYHIIELERTYMAYIHRAGEKDYLVLWITPSM